MPWIRDAWPGDALAIATVNVASWRVAYRDLLPADVLAGLSVPERERWWAGLLAKPPERTAVLLATDGDAVIGFASVGPSLDVDAPADTGTLYTLYLDPDHWGRGVGARLHAAAVRRLLGLGYTSATLWVLDGNERATGFYRRQGWSPDGHRQVDSGPSGVRLDEVRYGRQL